MVRATAGHGECESKCIARHTWFSLPAAPSQLATRSAVPAPYGGRAAMHPERQRPRLRTRFQPVAGRQRRRSRPRTARWVSQGADKPWGHRLVSLVPTDVSLGASPTSGGLKVPRGSLRARRQSSVAVCAPAKGLGSPRTQPPAGWRETRYPGQGPTRSGSCLQDSVPSGASRRTHPVRVPRPLLC